MTGVLEAKRSTLSAPMKVLTTLLLLLVTGAIAGFEALSNGETLMSHHSRTFSRGLDSSKDGHIHNGDITFFEPSMGSCGISSNANEDVVAISATHFDSYPESAARGGNPNMNPLCGKMIRLQRVDESGKPCSVDVKIVDRWRIELCAQTSHDFEYIRTLQDVYLPHNPEITLNSANAKHVLLQVQREAQLLSSSIPCGIPAHGRAMQSVSGSMLPKLQREGESKEEKSGNRIGDSSGGRGGVAPRPSSAAATSFPFPSSYFPDTTSVWSSPFVHESFDAPREPSPLGSQRSRTQYVEGEPALLGSRAGPGASHSPSRTSTSEKIPSQLVGRRSWADADVLIPTPESVKQYRIEQKEAANAQLRNFLSPSPASSFKFSLSVSPASDPPPRSTTPLKTPDSVHSQASVNTTSTISTQASDASTLAYELHRSRPDLRLLRKKSRPSQHTIQKASILKLPGDIKRSPSFFRPKVVADTAVIQPARTGVVDVPIPVAELEQKRQDLEDPLKRQPLRRNLTLAVPALTERRSQADLRLAELKVWQDPRRPLLSRATAPRILPPLDSSHSFPRPAELPARTLRFENTTVTDSHAEDTPRSQDTPATQSSRKSSGSAGQSHSRSRGKRQYHSVTPPDDQPRTITPLHHGDDYFQTFPVETVPSRDFVPLKTPQPIPEPPIVIEEKPWVEADPPLSTIDPTSAVFPLEQHAGKISKLPPRPRLNSERRKQSSIFAFFRKTAFNDKVFEQDNENAEKVERLQDIGKASLVPALANVATPGVTLSMKDESASKRRLSSVVPEMQAQSYFSRPRVRRQQSDSTLSPSGLATPSIGGSEIQSTPSPFRPRSRQQHRSSSEHLSPTATPQNRPRALHRSTQESLHGEYAAMNTLPRSAIAEVQNDVASQKLSTAATSEGRRRSLKFTLPVKLVRNESPAPTRRLTAIRDRSSVVFSNLFADLRKASSAELLLAKEPSREQNFERRKSLTARLSFALPKITLDNARASFAGGRKLQRKSSQSGQQMRSTDSGEVQPRSKSPPKGGMQPTNVPPDRRFSANDLRVTNFEQTPYSQRYHDAKRALQQQIRAFVDQSLDEVADDEEDDELVLGFEHDVPDHLPNSPLCPLHPRHKSGGKAICPQHGRYKKRKSPIAALSSGRPAMSRSVCSTTAFSGHHRMEIVFDTREEGGNLRAASLAAALEKSSEDLRARAASMAASLAAAVEQAPVEDVKQRTASMGSDGAGPSPAASAESQKWCLAMAAEGVEWVDFGRGRTQVKQSCGSQRRRRRRGRMRRSA